MIEGLRNGLLLVLRQAAQIIGCGRSDALDDKRGGRGHNPNSPRNSSQPTPRPAARSWIPSSTPAAIVGSALILAVAFQDSMTSVTAAQFPVKWLWLSASNNSKKNSAIYLASKCSSHEKLCGGAKLNSGLVPCGVGNLPAKVCSTEVTVIFLPVNDRDSIKLSYRI